MLSADSTHSLVLMGDALKRLKQLPDDSMHCVVTSPPYFQQRDYGVDGQIGLEETPDKFIKKLVAVFREVRRVLHPSGTCWINIGDSYAAGGYGGGGSYMQDRHKEWAQKKDRKGWRSTPGIKRKDLIGIPWQLAFALRADGWYLRGEIIWHKTTAFPESVTDRPAKAHETIFLLSKSEKYFYDADAIREKDTETTNAEEYEANKVGSHHDHLDDLGAGQMQKKKANYKVMTHPLGRNKRSVWPIAGEPSKEKHYATFPTKLPETCIKAGTSEKGCCANCRAPYVAIKSKTVSEGHGTRKRQLKAKTTPLGSTSVFKTGSISFAINTGWKRSCRCKSEERKPCVVLDPFAGAGTTMLVASRLGRDSVGIELNPEYVMLAHRRIYNDRPMFNRVESQDPAGGTIMATAGSFA